MADDRVEISEIAARITAYTLSQSGIAVLAHTDAGSADLFVDGRHHREVLTKITPPGGTVVRLRARRANNYLFFELLSPLPPELLTEMAELYNRLIQARLSIAEMLALLNEAGV
jgi:hypothetical protein